MLGLFLVLLVVFVSLIVILWGGTYFFQGYIYTEPSPGIFWQAPAAALFLTLGFTLWLIPVALMSETTKTNVPISTPDRFSPYEDMLKRPAVNVWAIRATGKKDDKEGERVAYKSVTGVRMGIQTFEYKDAQGNKWQSQNVTAIEIEIDDPANPKEKQKLRFDKTPSGVDDYELYVAPGGWAMRDYTKDGLTGSPVRFRLTRLLLNLFYNIAHFVGWFLALWLILRFQWSHALGFALVMWLATTFLILPMMLGYAAEVAEARRQTTTVLLAIWPLAA